MNLLELLEAANGGQNVNSLSRQFGLNGQQTHSVLEQVLPALSQGVQRNVGQQGGLESLLGALSSGRHTEYIDNPAALSRPETITDGNGILGHLLGSKDVSRSLAQHVSGATGVSEAVIKQMLPLVASLAMGALAKEKPAEPQGLLGLLDFNRNGSAVDDIVGMMGKLFGR